MQIEVKMNTDVFYELLTEAVKKSVETTKKELSKLEYYTEEEAMEILGYKSKINFKRNIQKFGIDYRRIGRKMFIHKDDMNRLIDRFGRLDPTDRKKKIINREK